MTNTADRPIKFDRLIRDAVFGASGNAVQSYSAIPICADPNLANGALITLVFDGGSGHCRTISGTRQRRRYV